jgi:hypothetical protein
VDHTGRRLRVHRALGALVLAATGALLAGCGGSSSGRQTDERVVAHAPRTTPQPSPTSPSAPPPGAADVAPRPGSVRDLKARCFGETTELVEAYLTYVSPFHLDESDSRRFSARLIQEPDLAGLAEEKPHGHLEVQCTVEARLVTGSEEVSTANTDWTTQNYLPPAETRWTWVVTGNRPGRSEAVVELRPVLRITDEGGEVKEPLGTESFDVTFVVSRSAGSWLSSTGGAIVAAASGLTVVAGAAVALSRIVRRKQPVRGD